MVLPLAISSFFSREMGHDSLGSSAFKGRRYKRKEEEMGERARVINEGIEKGDGKNTKTP